MKKPVYRHPEFVLKSSDNRNEKENKRLWLSLTIDNKRTESIIVILKNPSQATKEISDKTVYTVTTFIYKNRNKFKQLKNIGKIIFLNLIPFYETDSTQLKSIQAKINDKGNLDIIKKLTSENKKVIIAWGNHPNGLSKEYKILKKYVYDVLKETKNNVFYVDRFTIKGNPKHGQVWSYEDELRPLKF